jgi:hypothetical protein
MVTRTQGAGEQDVAGRSTSAKQVHPAAYGALIEALAKIYWYKKDLAKFIKVRARDYPALLSGIDFDGYKRSFAEEFVDRLQENEATYQDLTLSIMLEVSQMDAFPGLARPENSAELIAQAKTAVATLKTWTEKHQGLLDEQDKFAAELAANQARMEAQKGFTAKLAELRKQFDDLAAMADRQKAGKLFENFLNQLFHLFDLEPRLSYELASEQIDGSLTFDTDDYIIEAKWWKTPMEREHFDTFDAKVKRKGKNALGLFIAVNGFTGGALREYSQRTSFLTMDGGDLICVLDGRITLDELLRRKKRYANETGNCYFPAHQAIAE